MNESNENHAPIVFVVVNTPKSQRAPGKLPYRLSGIIRNRTQRVNSVCTGVGQRSAVGTGGRNGQNQTYSRGES